VASATGAPSSYLLGHAEAEVDRLLLQGRLYNDHTERALRLAGLAPGMRVLDVGCGPGDVSIVASRLVGPSGSVTGVDATPEILEFARTRAADSGLSTISFVRATIPDVPLAGQVDAVIGRLILMHLPDPVAALRRLATSVRPGGVIVFHEFDISSAHSAPELPLFGLVRDLIVRSFRGAGLPTECGSSLYSLFQRAGLPAPRLTLGAPMGGADDVDVFAFAVGVWRLMFPVAQRLGLVTDEVSDVDGLLPRLRTEAASADAVVTLPALISAWTTTSSG
jgi:SAM-dependent methyltransferase